MLGMLIFLIFSAGVSLLLFMVGWMIWHDGKAMEGY